MATPDPHIQDIYRFIPVSLLKQSLIIHALLSFLDPLAQCKFVRTRVAGKNQSSH